MKEIGRPGPLPGQHRKSFLQAPAVQALILQIISLFFVSLLNVTAAALWHVALGWTASACVQGACAAMLARRRGMAVWWLVIQLLFPIGLLAAQSLHFPPAIFLAAFLFFLLLYWSTFRTQVPFYPSGPAVWEEVAARLPHDRQFALVDIGSGLGGLVLHLARRFPQGRFTGVELAPLPWAISALRARMTGSAARFYRQDYNDLNLGDYDVVFAYLSPAAMPALWHKAKAEMRKDSTLLSYEFAIPDIEPSMTVSPLESGPILHIFYL